MDEFYANRYCRYVSWRGRVGDMVKTIYFMVLCVERIPEGIGAKSCEIVFENRVRSICNIIYCNIWCNIIYSVLCICVYVYMVYIIYNNNI